jgi:hypothetical protein
MLRGRASVKGIDSGNFDVRGSLPMFKFATVAVQTTVFLCGCMVAHAGTASTTTTSPTTAASPPTSTKSIPPNTINCRDWQRNADSTWIASPTAKPFDIGGHKDIKYAGRKIERYSAMFDDTDLWDVLEAKCRTQTEGKPRSQ